MFICLHSLLSWQCFIIIVNLFKCELLKTYKRIKLYSQCLVIQSVTNSVTQLNHNSVNYSVAELLSFQNKSQQTQRVCWKLSTLSNKYIIFMLSNFSWHFGVFFQKGVNESFCIFVLFICLSDILAKIIK